MKITFRAAAFTVDTVSGFRVSAPQSLNDWSYGRDRIENYFDNLVADQGVRGGLIRASVLADGSAQILVDFWSPLSLGVETIDLLTKETMGQLSDGMGENGFEVTGPNSSLRLIPDLERPLEVEQINDGKEVRGASRIAISARDGDLLALKDAISSGAGDIDELHQGHTGFQLATLYGHVDAALLLVESGADLEKETLGGCTALALCATARSLSDEDSVRLAQALIERGAEPSRIGSTRYDAAGLADLAEQRDKKKLAEFFSGRA